MVDLSVLLVVRDWSTERLALSLDSLRTALSRIDGEVVLLDYGSDEAEPYEHLAEEFGARYVRAESPVWSRSRALNIAAAAASGRWYLFADADMLWSPKSLEKSLELAESNPNQYLVFQARDLPQQFDGAHLTAHGYDWSELESHASWRPRWGMGMQLVPRDRFRLIQGLDERMVIYGGEDNDMAKRLQRSGLVQHWVNDPDVRVYHIWHPSSRQSAMLSEDGAAAIALNREIKLKDESIVRNLPQWVNRPADADPLVSVVIVTRDRQEYLRESIESVLAQSFQDLEIIIIDDGEEDGVQALTESFGDARIRYVKSRERGIAAGRNYAAEISRGHYTAIHDDDDLMLPWSVESRLAALRAGDVGSYGGVYHFDDATGALELIPGKNFSLEAVYVAGKVFYHPAVLVETSVLRRIKYEPTLRSGSDYNLFVRAAMAGYHMRHCGDVVLLKRQHANQVTEADSVIQKASATVTNGFTNLGQSLEQRASSRKSGYAVKPYPYDPALLREDRFAPWLPSRLVDRVAIYRHNGIGDDLRGLDQGVDSRDILVETPDSVVRYTVFPDVAPSVLSKLRAVAVDNGGEVELSALKKASVERDLGVLAEAGVIRRYEREATGPTHGYMRVEEEGAVMLSTLADVESLLAYGDEGIIVHSPSSGAKTVVDLAIMMGEQGR